MCPNCEYFRRTSFPCPPVPHFQLVQWSVQAPYRLASRAAARLPHLHSPALFSAQGRRRVWKSTSRYFVTLLLPVRDLNCSRHSLLYSFISFIYIWQFNCDLPYYKGREFNSKSQYFLLIWLEELFCLFQPSYWGCGFCHFQPHSSFFCPLRPPATAY